MAKKTKKTTTRSSRVGRKGRHVAGVGSAVSSGQARTALSDKIEAAMSQAVKDALKDGVSLDDSAEIRKRMAAARERVLAGG